MLGHHNLEAQPLVWLRTTLVLAVSGLKAEHGGHRLPNMAPYQTTQQRQEVLDWFCVQQPHERRPFQTVKPVQVAVGGRARSWPSSNPVPDRVWVPCRAAKERQTWESIQDLWIGAEYAASTDVCSQTSKRMGVSHTPPVRLWFGWFAHCANPNQRWSVCKAADEVPKNVRCKVYDPKAAQDDPRPRNQCWQ